MLEFTRVLSNADTDPYDDFDWVFEDITIKDEKERVIFSCARAEFPAGWSDLAKKIVASKYFRADRKGDGEETSVRQMVERVVSFITNEGLKQKYFEGENAKIFHDELVHLILRQMGTFNSPVWFNAGVPGVTKPQNSACFINQVDDSMESILDLAKTEGLIFKEGSGSGVNLSALRGSNEKVKGGGTASGPVSFMSGYDAFANVILSGGRTRRAARMAILDIDHPDIRKFINCKSEQEDIVKLLVLGGMSPVFTAENNAYDIVKHQSGNNSVMLTDKFMERVRDILHGYKPDHQWDLINRVGGEIAETLSVKDLFFDIVKAAHKCGDPGLQFSDTINAGNTCKADGKIVGSNPCLCGSMTLATPKGNRKIKTLAKEGTAKIINSKGNTVDSNIWSSGIRPVVKICFSHRTRIPPLRCTPDHVWKLNDGTTEEAQNLLRHTRLMPYIVMKENYDKDAFLAGFIQGDGSPQRLKSKPHKGLEIHLASKDTEIALMYDQIPGPRKWYSRYAYRIAEKYKLDPVTLPTRKLPKALPKHKVCDFLAGLYSANGSVITKSRIALKTSCNALAIGVQNLLLQLGIHNYITTNKAHDVKFPNGTYTCKESYDVNIVQFTSLLLFTKKINFKQQYKRDALFAMLLARSPAIESVRFDGVEEVFDFTEPETHWGVVNNFISHNCGELVFLNNTACNLASLNLSKFADDTGFNATQFRHAVRLFVIAQDILVEASGYPTSTIEKNTHKYRPLGLGYTNLGGFLMSNAIPYDSNEGRAIATSITNLLTSQAYLTSSEIASHMGPFAGFEDNKTHMEDVLDMHYTAAKHAAIDPWGLNKAALTTWRSTINTGFGKKEAGTGFRNSQTTLLAPTGTLSFMMDCSTTGIEPDIGLKKTKRQVDGTVITYVNSSVPSALKKLDYEDEHQERLLAYVNEHGHLENSILKSEHLPIFDCSLPVANRRLSVDGHLDMVAAVQPFLSGSISKTYNMPHNASLNDIALVFLKAWEKKVKGITIYRDGSKMSEPLKVKELLKEAKSHAHREVLPNDRDSKTHKFTIGGQSGYLTVGFYPDGRIGEIFLRMGGHGATITGLLDAFATACSFLLQHGVPLELLIRKFKKTKFNPAGITGNPDVPMADSVLAYVFRFLEIHYLKKTEETNTETAQLDISADLCSNCGNIMVRTGTCLQCKNCGESQGVCS